MNRYPARDTEGFPIVANSGEVVDIEEILFLQLAAAGLNAESHCQLYEVILPLTERIGYNGEKLPEDRRRVRVDGAWADDPRANLVDFVIRVKAIQSDLGELSGLT